MNERAAPQDSQLLSWSYQIGEAQNARTMLAFIILTPTSLFVLRSSPEVIDVSNLATRLPPLLELDDEHIWRSVSDLFKKVEDSEVPNPGVSERLGLVNKFYHRSASRIALSAIRSCEYHGYLMIAKTLIRGVNYYQEFLVGHNQSAENLAAARRIFMAIREFAAIDSAIMTRQAAVLEAYAGPGGFMVLGIFLGLLIWLFDDNRGVGGWLAGLVMFIGGGVVLIDRYRKHPVVEYWVSDSLPVTSDNRATVNHNFAGNVIQASRVPSPEGASSTAINHGFAYRVGLRLGKWARRK